MLVLPGWDESIRFDLADVDLVSIKVDAFSDVVWRKINHPIHDLSLEKIKDGIRRFCRQAS